MFEPNREFSEAIGEVPYAEGGADPCYQCGLCTAVCPIQNYVQKDFDPRKFVRMVVLGKEEELLRSELLWLCLLCNSCGYNCPRGVKFSHIVPILRERAIKENYQGIGFLKKILYKFLLPSRGRMECAVKFLKFYQNYESTLKKLGISSFLPQGIRALEAILPPVADTPLRKQLPDSLAAETKPKYRVAYFIGCANDMMFTDVGKATICLLRKAGATVFIPEDIKCCGMPFIGLTDIGLAKEMAKHNIRVLEALEVDFIITDCATCGSFLKEYPLLLADERGYAVRARLFASMVLDVNQFLSKALQNGHLGRFKAKVAFHDPCHLRKTQGVWREVRELLRKVEGLEFSEMQEPLLCCGGAGTYNAFHHEESLKVLERKLANLQGVNPDVVLTSCPGCILQLRLGAHMKGNPFKVMHITQALNQALEGKER